MTQNQIGFFNAQETKRHQVATEAELNRHNLVVEGLQTRANEIQERMNQETAEHYRRSDANASEANAINRQHYRTSDTTQRIQAIEQGRHNVVTEQLNAQMNAINAAIAAESRRHNFETEELTRSLNTATIAYDYAKAAETGANTGLLRAKTEREFKETRLADARARSAEVNAGIDEKIRGLERGSDIVESWSRSTSNYLKPLSDVIGVLVKTKK